MDSEDYYNFINCNCLDQFNKIAKLFFSLPSGNFDKPEMGSKWLELAPEANDFDPYFTYESNSTGFRDTEILTDVDICYYGCSVTFGAGVPIEARFSNVLDKKMNYKSNNFAISGIGNYEIFKLFLVTSRFINMKKAVIVFPDIHRLTLPLAWESKEVCYTRFHPNYYDLYEDKNVRKICKNYYSLPEIFYYDRFLTDLESIIEIAKLKNIELYISSWRVDIDLLKELTKNHSHVKIIDVMILDNKGRDCVIQHVGAHPGIDAHNHYAELIAKLIKS